MENSSNRFYGLDHLRALAILMVLIYHYLGFAHPDWMDRYGRFGWTGVDLFFVLSGFLISSQLFKEIQIKEHINFKNFYTKRFFRIIPPYVVTLLLYFCLPVFREREALAPLWKFITFTQNFGLDVINYGTFSHAWSLCIEEQFYVFLPLFLFIFMKLKVFKYAGLLIGSLLLFSMLSRYLSWHALAEINNGSGGFFKEWYRTIYYPTYTRLDGLSVGVLIGFFFCYSSKFKAFINSNGNLLLIIGVCLMAVSFWLCTDQTSEKASVFGFTFVSISCGLLVMSAISDSSFLYRSKSFLTAELASLSYAIYLSHKGLIRMTHNIIEYLDFDSSGNIALIICLLMCIISGLLFRHLLERPSAWLKDKIVTNHLNKV